MSAPWPLPFPKPALLPFDFDFDEFFLAAQENVRQSRVYRNQPPLIPDQQILVGQEQLSKQLTPPTIVVVPRGVRYRSMRHIERTSFTPELLWSAWIQIDAHCWGHEDPDQRSELYSFSTSLELMRQFLVSVQFVTGDVSRIEANGAEWVQDVDINRLGRHLVVSIGIEYSIAVDPPILASFVTGTKTGIQVSVTADLQTSLDNPTSTVTEAVFVVP